MKTSLQVLALLTLLSASALTARADEEPPSVKKPFYVFYRTSSPTDFRVYINKSAHESLTVTLKNRNGDQLYSSWVGKNDPGKALSFNMAQQPDGTYTVEVKGKHETVTKTFVLSTPASDRFLAIK